METRRVHEVVHTLRQKPVHIRERIALGTALSITFLVAAGWAVAGSMNGTFSLAPKSFEAGQIAKENAAAIGQATEASKSGFTQLLGAAGAAVGATTTPTTITIVDTKVHTTLDTQDVDPNATVIHF